jgi:hypothetical protein
MVVAEMPSELAKRAVPYLALFRKPDSPRGLAWSKALGLLASLRQMASESHIQWDGGVSKPNSIQVWVMALERLLQAPPRRLPLTSHGYLKSIAYDIASELAREADKRNEAARIAAERSGNFRKQSVGEENRYQRLDLEEMRRIAEKNYKNRKRLTGDKGDEGNE